MRNITNIPLNTKVVVKKINHLFIAQKLYSMGILPNSSIEIIRKTFNDNTFFLSINQKHQIAIRKKEAEHIIVEELS